MANSLREAIQKAKSDPTGENSAMLKQAIVSGKMDSMAQSEGIDLTAFKGAQATTETPMGESAIEKPSFGERFKETGVGEVKQAFDVAGQAREKFEQGEYIEGAGKTFSAGAKLISSPINALFGAALEPTVEKGITAVQDKWKEKASPEDQEALKNIMTKAVEGYDDLPSEAKTALQVMGGMFDIGLPIGGTKIAKEVGQEVAEKVGKEGLETVGKVAKKEAGVLGTAFGELRKSTMEKNIANAEKLATEILQPKKKDIQLAKLAGDSTSSPIKEYVKVAEEAVDFDDGIKKLDDSIKKDMDIRDRRIAEDNFDIDNARPIQELEQHIAEAESKGLASDSQIQGMKEVLEKEKSWLETNSPDRVSAQNRKTDVYKEAQPIYKKMDAGTALGNEEGRAKAFELLGQGYKEVVENGDTVIRDINASYGGKVGAMEMLAGRGALADKALAPTFLQKLASPIIGLVSQATGAGSASFVTKLALNQEKSLKMLTTKLTQLREAVNKGKSAGFIEKQLKEISDELPKLKGDYNLKDGTIDGKTITSSKKK